MRDIIRVDAEPDISTRPRAIKNAYALFQRRRQRLFMLDRAYDTGQVPPRDYPTVVNNCKNICDTKTAYIAGIPPAYSTSEGDTRGQEVIDLYQQQNKARTDQEVTAWAGRYGLSHEVVYMDRDWRTGKLVPKSVAVTPLESFVAWDWSLDPKPVFGAVHYFTIDDNLQQHHFLDIYDDTDVVRYALSDASAGSWTEVPGTRRPHGFDRVPVIEYRNNPDLRSDIEAIIPLQAALNEVLSDRVRDKTRFANAMLVSKGFALADSDVAADEAMTRLKDEPMLSIPRDADLQYLVKTFDESSVQVLVDYIDRQMHKVSGVPDLTSESFAGNTSGVAIKWSMQSMENLAQSFVAQFIKGFAIRCKLYSYALFGSEDAIDNQAMNASFRFNVPSDDIGDAQTMQVYVNAHALSTRTMMEHCPYVDDADIEQERIDEEDSKNAERQAASFEDRAYNGMDRDESEDEPEDEEQPDEDSEDGDE